MEDSHKLWFRPVEAGWNLRFFEKYFETPLGTAIRGREEEAVYGLLGSAMEPHHSVLEVGCGTGNYARCPDRGVETDAPRVD